MQQSREGIGPAGPDCICRSSILAVVHFVCALGDRDLFRDLYDFAGASRSAILGRISDAVQSISEGNLNTVSGCDRGRRVFRHGGQFKQDGGRYQAAYG